MSWFSKEVAVGYAGQKIGNKRRYAEVQAQLQEQVSRLQPRPVVPPLATQNWFSAEGLFAFGLPQTFVRLDRSKWSGPAPLLVVEDGEPASGMWLAVVQDQHLALRLDPGFSPWIAAVQPEVFRQQARNWGGTVVSGPEPILLGGEPAIAACYGMVEQGRENRKWVAFALHNGSSFEVVLGVDPQTEAAYIDAFWTAVGSWRWGGEPATAKTAGLDDAHAAQPGPSGFPSVAPPEAVAQQLSTPVGTFGVPAGWEPFDAEALYNWSHDSASRVVGAISKFGPKRSPIIDVTLFGEYSADPWTGAHQSAGEYLARTSKYGMRVLQGPHRVLVGGCPAFWAYTSGPQPGVASAHVSAFMSSNLVGLALTATEVDFDGCVDSFWTVVATTQWS